MAKGTKSASKCDRHGGKNRNAMHRNQERWLDRQQEKLEDRINALAITGGRQQLAKRFDALSMARNKAWKLEQEKLANTSLKDIIH